MGLIGICGQKSAQIGDFGGNSMFGTDDGGWPRCSRENACGGNELSSTKSNGKNREQGMLNEYAINYFFYEFFRYHRKGNSEWVDLDASIR